MNRYKITAEGPTGGIAAETIIENDEAAAYRTFDDYCRSYAAIYWNDYKVSFAVEIKGEWTYKIVRKFTTV